MKAAVLRAPGGLDRIEIQDIPSSSLDQLADVFRYQAGGTHFGKVAVEW
jgi:hypothetical protein